MRRWPTLAALAACIVALVFVQLRLEDPSGEPAEVAGQATLVPLSASAPDSGSTWYCAGGVTTPDGVNDHEVTITNNTGELVRGSLTIYPAQFGTRGESLTFDRAVQTLEVGPNSQQKLSLAPLVSSLDPDLAIETGSFVGAVAEFSDPSVTVHHTIRSPFGTDTGPCATSAASQWWFPSGTTSPDVGYQLYLLNPFPDDAVVDVTFVTDEGIREPGSFQGRLVPAQSLVVLNVSQSVSVFEQIAAEVHARSGRVIAERVQIFGSETGPGGVSMSLGASQLSSQWFFPSGRALRGVSESYVIFNPGDEAAVIELEAKPDSAERAGDAVPIPVDVGPRERWIVTLRTDPSHPVNAIGWVDARGSVTADENFFVSVRSFNGVPVVVERILTRPVADGPGVAASLGATLAATDLLLPLGDAETRSSGMLMILNPDGDSIARVQIIVASADGERVREELELGPRRRGVFTLESLGVADEAWIRVVSSRGVVVELIEDSQAGVSVTEPVPVRGTTSTPELLSFD